MDKDGIVSDKPYDEAIDLGNSDDDDVSTPDNSGSEAGDASGMSPKRGLGAGAGVPSPQSSPGKPASSKPQRTGGEDNDESSSDGSGDSESESSTDEEAEGGQTGPSALPANAYNPDEFKNMKVSPEIEE